MIHLKVFLDNEVTGVEHVYNEHALQLELALYFRQQDYRVRLELPFSVESLTGSIQRRRNCTSKRWVLCLIDPFLAIMDECEASNNTVGFLLQRGDLVKAYTDRISRADQ
jgi:hypothetical protein